MKILMITSVMLSSSYVYMTHPVGFLIVILTQALLICLMSWMVTKSGWFSFIIFLIFLGGLMVLFVYITSLASNEMVYSTNLGSVASLCIVSTPILIFLILSNKESTVLSSEEVSKTVFIMYSPSFGMLTMFTMVYLLLTLIVVVKIADQFDAPIKNIW